MRQVVLVCGGRDYLDRRKVYSVLDAEHDSGPIMRLVTGGANGADRLAADWAAYAQVKCDIFHADWDMYGPSAGPRRNQEMLDKGQPDIVIAFPGGKGTADMVRRAKAQGVEVVKIPR